MPSELRLLTKVMVTPFYQRNAGFFLVAFLLLFGAVSPQMALLYHLSIMEALAHSILLLPAAVVWLFYGVKCAQHGFQELSLPESEFLTYVSLFPTRRQLYSLFVIQALLYLPIWLYVLATVGVAVYQQAWGAAALMVGYNFFVCSVVAYLFYRKIRFPNQESISLKFFQYTDRRLTKSYPAFFWSYLLRKELVLLLSTKFFSLFMLIGGILLLPALDDEARVLRIGFLLSAFTHLMLVQQLRKFEETDLLFTRNLPLPISVRFGRYALLYLGILIPEVTILAKECFSTLNWTILIEYTSFALSFCLLCHCFLFINHMTTKRYISRAFYAFVAFYLMIMFSLSLLAIALSMVLLAYYLLHQLFYEHEWTENIGGRTP